MKSKTSQSQIENPMRKIFIEKVVLSAGATGDNLTKAGKLLEYLTSKKAQIIESRKRVPDFGVSPGMKVGTRVTLRKKEDLEILKRLLGAVENKLSKKQVAPNHLSFGIKEYIEIPGAEYQREIGIRGLNVTVVFARAGLRVKRKKIKKGDIPKRQHISKQEIIDYMEKNYKTQFT